MVNGYINHCKLVGRDVSCSVTHTRRCTLDWLCRTPSILLAHSAMYPSIGDIATLLLLQRDSKWLYWCTIAPIKESPCQISPLFQSQMSSSGQ